MLPDETLEKMDLDHKRLILEKKRAILESQFKQDLIEIKNVSHPLSDVHLI